MTKIQKEYQIGDAEGGALQTAFVVSYMIFAPIFGYLGDRHNRKAIMAFGVFIWTIFTIIGSFMPVRTTFLPEWKLKISQFCTISFVLQLFDVLF